MTGRASPFRSCVTNSFFSRANLPGRKIALSFASTVLRKSNRWLATSSRASNGCLLYAKLIAAFSRRIQVVQRREIRGWCGSLVSLLATTHRV